MKASEVSEEVVKQALSMYIDTNASVRTSDGDSEFFNISTGVLQGDTLAPFLFIWMIDYILRCAIEDSGVELVLQKAKSRRQGCISVSGFAFADEIALVASSIDDAQRLPLAVDKVSSEIGLMLNEYMIVSGDPDISNSKFDLKSADHSILKWV